MLYAAFPDNVKDLPLFSGMTEQDKQALLAGGKVRNCPRGQMLFAHGEPVTHFFVVVSGAFRLFRANVDGHEKTIDIVKSGQTMCEGEIMDSCLAHRANAVPVEDSVVMAFPAAWLKDAAQKYNIFALNLLSLLAQQMHLAEVEAEHQATMSAAQLVACFMQRLCVIYDFDPKGFDLPYSKSLIASRLGMELATFSRTLAKLKDHGITVEGSRVMITDLERIESYVCGACSVSGECQTHQSMEKMGFDEAEKIG